MPMTFLRLLAKVRQTFWIFNQTFDKWIQNSEHHQRFRVEAICIKETNFKRLKSWITSSDKSFPSPKTPKLKLSIIYSCRDSSRARQNEWKQFFFFNSLNYSWNAAKDQISTKLPLFLPSLHEAYNFWQTILILFSCVASPCSGWQQERISVLTLLEA